MQNTYLEHPAEEVLERFILHQSDETELDVVETHVLACESCVDRLEALELQIAATKTALQEFHMESVERALSNQGTSWRSWLTMPKLSMAGSAAALALGLFLVPQFVNSHAPVAQVSLVAYRGLETPVVPKDHTLQVHLNANDLSESKVQVELVDDRGSDLWQGVATVQGDEVELTVPKITATGTHFFRIYTSAQTGEKELLREFAFQVK
jgi:anti-sigma factor RsiW